MDNSNELAHSVIEEPWSKNHKKCPPRTKRMRSLERIELLTKLKDKKK